MTSWRNASTTRSFALTLPALHDTVAAWLLCPGAAVVAFAAAPATPRPAAVRATATAARCNFRMTGSFVLDARNTDLIVQVNVNPSWLDQSSHPASLRGISPSPWRYVARLGQAS